MQEALRVTIAVPIYNIEKYIEVCLHSIFGQTYNNIEYVFVDDCTPDHSVQVVQKVLEQYPERKDYVRIVHHERNRGLSVARNTAIENATGEFIFHVDSDDYIELDAVERLVEKQMETDADLVVANYLIEHKDRTSFVRYFDITKSKEQIMLDSLNEKCSHSVWGILIRKTLYTENNIKAKEGVNVGEDWQVASQLLYYAKKIAYVDTLTYHYLMSRPGSYTIESFESVTKKKNHLIQFVKTQQYLLECFKGKEQIYVDLIYRKIVTFVQDAMIFSVKDKDRKTFNELKCVFETVPLQYYDILGKSSWLSMCIKKNYYMMRLILKIKRS